MSMLSQYLNFTEIGEMTKLQLFSEAYRDFRASVYQYDPDPEVREAMRAYSQKAEERLQLYYHIFRILGIYEDFQTSTEAEVEMALKSCIS